MLLVKQLVGFPGTQCPQRTRSISLKTDSILVGGLPANLNAELELTSKRRQAHKGTPVRGGMEQCRVEPATSQL